MIGDPVRGTHVEVRVRLVSLTGSRAGPAALGRHERGRVGPHLRVAHADAGAIEQVEIDAAGETEPVVGRLEELLVSPEVLFNTSLVTLAALTNGVILKGIGADPSSFKRALARRL